jgi:lactadherin
MISGDIQDWQISASSTNPQDWDKGCHERFARLYHPNGQSWCAKYKAPSEWLQIDLGVASKVTGLMTQGRGNGQEWVTAFMVSYSLDAYDWEYVEDFYGNQRVFEGNSDSDSVKHSYLEEPIIARFVRFQTVHWNEHPSMRVELVGCQPCRQQLALPPYVKVSASSERQTSRTPAGDSNCQAEDGFIVTNKAWCARHDNGEQWLQFDIGPPTLVTGMVTRGRGDSGRKHWITRFRLSYSNDSVNWTFYKDATHLEPKEFGGNVDKDIERIHYLNNPFIARFVRFHPIDWNRHVSMRAGLFGCPYTGQCTTGFMRINDYTPCVANVALHKESFVSNKRQYKRHVRNQWTHGQASRAVDGDPDSSLHSCTLLDNFYVEKPVWMVDLGTQTKISGVVIVTWQGQLQGSSETPSRTASYGDYTHNLDRLTVYVDSKAGAEAIDLPGKMCGFVSRLNSALFRPRLYVQCVRPLTGRYVYVEASGVAQRRTRLFSAVLCEVMVYE